jgi:hypothetical protein
LFTFRAHQPRGRHGRRKRGPLHEVSPLTHDVPPRCISRPRHERPLGSRCVALRSGDRYSWSMDHKLGAHGMKKKSCGPCVVTPLVV